MDRTDDITFLQQFRAVVNTYLGGNSVPPNASYHHYLAQIQRIGNRYAQARRAIVQGRNRAQRLLAECGCQYLFDEAVVDISVGEVTHTNHRLFDVLLDNPLDRSLPAAFFLDPIDEAIGMLHWRQEKPQIDIPQAPQQIAAPPDELSGTIEVLEYIAQGFPRAAARLTQRREGRAPFEIRDEYDVQDLFGALLALFFDDIRPEEPAPSHAGSSTRIDFMLANEGVMLEIKMTRRGLGDHKIKEQLLVDIPQYCRHPDCKAVVAFVYDPEKRIRNPAALETDLSHSWNGVPVHVFVVA